MADIIASSRESFCRGDSKKPSPGHKCHIYGVLQEMQRKEKLSHCPGLVGVGVRGGVIGRIWGRLHHEGKSESGN